MTNNQFWAWVCLVLHFAGCWQCGRWGCLLVEALCRRLERWLKDRAAQAPPTDGRAPC